MRLFIAVDIPTDSKNLIENKINKVKNDVKQNIKWVQAKNWHLTLKFLGEIESKKINDIKNTLSETGYNDKFTIKFCGINAFPNLSYPKVIFVGIDKGKNKLIKIHKEIDKKLTKIGLTPEKREYTPHLTIARSRRNTDMKKLAEKLSKYDRKNFINVDIKLENIKLIKSELYRNGPVYKDIFTIFMK